MLWTLSPAKINLTLGVSRDPKLPYHYTWGLASFLSLYDLVGLSLSPQPKSPPPPQRHISVSFYNTRKQKLTHISTKSLQQSVCWLADLCHMESFRLHIRVIKRIPVAAGLGGSSANNAAVLRILSNLWNTNVTYKQLPLYLGVDLPLCLLSKTASFSHFGEVVQPLHLPPQNYLENLFVLLVNPNVPLSTAQVFCRFSALNNNNTLQTQPIHNQHIQTSFTSTSHFLSFLSQQGNDLLPSAQQLCPQISPILSFLQQHKYSLYASLSGSGPTCFALFENLPHTLHAMKLLRQFQCSSFITRVHF